MMVSESSVRESEEDMGGRTVGTARSLPPPAVPPPAPNRVESEEVDEERLSFDEERGADDDGVGRKGAGSRWTTVPPRHSATCSVSMKRTGEFSRKERGRVREGEADG